MSKVAPPKITYVTLFADESIHPKYEAALKKFEQETLGRRYPMYLGDEEVWSEAGEFAHRSPIDTSVVVGRFQKGVRAHAKDAIARAKEGFETWRSKGWKERVGVMNRAAALIDERKFDIAVAITYEVGKNRLEALAECWEAVDAIKYYSKIMEDNNGYVEKTGPGGPGEACRVLAKPFGVWPVISPFNFPFMLASGMALGALMTGNSVVLKPTSEAPLTGLLLYKVYRDAGVPAGTVNFVTGPGGNFEKEFVSNPDVAGIAFTGSREVGMRLYREFLTQQRYPKPMVLEMGSKNPVVVTSSAEISKAVEGTVRAAFGYGGQKCSAASRIYVQTRVKDRFLNALRERVGEVRVGDPRRKDVFMGPVINAQAVEKFKSVVAEARAGKGKLFAGGKVLRAGKLAKGYYVTPTVVTGLPSTHRLFRDELFLPFVVVDEFDTLEEALTRVNDTDYGLTAGIFSNDSKEIKEFMGRTQFGVVYSNRSGGATTGAWPGAQSFTGWNASGATGRGVGGSHYLLNFTRDQSQTVVS
jgi:1-pyrroline-5-carboxylate dehydrogenase